MAANRMTRFESDPAGPSPKPQSDARQPGPAVPPGFAVCPPQLMAAGAWQQQIYRLAYEQALAAVQLPRHHRWLFSVWN